MNNEFVTNAKLDKFVYEIAQKVSKEISVFQKIFLLVTQNSEIHHWGFCLYIRNEYIYGNENLKSLNIDPDELSEKILKKVLNIWNRDKEFK